MSDIKSYVLTPRDVLFFRDARPMDVSKKIQDDYVPIGHGANWPRPDHLYSAIIHELIGDVKASERNWYTTVHDLQVSPLFPKQGDTIYLPFPRDFNMKVLKLPEGEYGLTDMPRPLSCGFVDKKEGKKDYPKWLSLEVYKVYLEGKESGESFQKPTLYHTAKRNGTTLDRDTGASKRTDGKESGQYQAEYLELAKGISMICAVNKDVEDCDVRMGGQGGTVHIRAASIDLMETLKTLPKGTPTKYVRWTLISPALFENGWMPNWLNEEGKVMIPQNRVLRKPEETRAQFRKRLQAESKFFETAHLVGACIGGAEHFSGYDSETKEKPTQLTVPAGSVYLFECKDEEEASALVERLHLQRLSDLGEKGFGLGLCSYVTEPTRFEDDPIEA